MEKPISEHLKKIVDDFISKFGINETLRKVKKIQRSNQKLYEDHVAANEKGKAISVQKNININNKAIKYLKEKQNENEK